MLKRREVKLRQKEIKLKMKNIFFSRNYTALHNDDDNYDDDGN